MAASIKKILDSFNLKSKLKAKQKIVYLSDLTNFPSKLTKKQTFSYTLLTCLPGIDKSQSTV